MLGFKGPRKMSVVIPGMLNESKRKEFRPESENDGIIGKYSNIDMRFPVFQNNVVMLHLQSSNDVCFW